MNAEQHIQVLRDWFGPQQTTEILNTMTRDEQWRTLVTLLKHVPDTAKQKAQHADVVRAMEEVLIYS